MLLLRNHFLHCLAGFLCAFDGLLTHGLAGVDGLFAYLLGGRDGFVLGVFGLVTHFANYVLTFVSYEAGRVGDFLACGLEHVFGRVHYFLFTTARSSFHGSYAVASGNSHFGDAAVVAEGPRFSAIALSVYARGDL